LQNWLDKEIKKMTESNNLNKFWNVILLSGTSDKHSYRKDRDIIFVNQVSFFAFLLTLPVVLATYLIFPNEQYHFALLGLSVFYNVGVLLNAFRVYSIAKIFLSIWLCTIIFLGASTFGQTSDIQFFYVLVIFGSFLFANRSDQVTSIVLLFIPFVFLVVLYASHYHLFFSQHISKEQLFYLSNFSLLTTSVGTIILSLAYLKNTRKITKILIHEQQKTRKLLDKSTQLNQELKQSKETVKQNNDLLKTIFDSSLDAIFLIENQSQKVVDCNAAALTLFKLPNKETIETKCIHQLIHQKLSLQALAKIRSNIKNTGKWTDELQFVSLEGGIFWGNVAISTISTQDEQFLLVRIADISEKKKSEMQLQAQNTELKKLNEALDRFVYSASHDLRAPISSILGLINIAKEENNVKQLHYYLELKEKSLRKLDTFITDILDHSRNTRMEIKKETIDFEDIVQSIFSNYSYSEHSENIEKTLKIVGSQVFVSDAYRLKIILNNLISNAIRYCNPRNEHPFIKVEIEMDAQKSFITISDNGIGIEEQYIERIFEMFFRATTAKTGSGLGLYIVKEAIEKLEGTIQVTSQINVGTTFKLMIPNLWEGDINSLKKSANQNQRISA
jgi:PAS domain S-box-containing protein